MKGIDRIGKLNQNSVMLNSIVIQVALRKVKEIIKFLLAHITDVSAISIKLE